MVAELSRDAIPSPNAHPEWVRRAVNHFEKQLAHGTYQVHMDGTGVARKLVMTLSFDRQAVEDLKL